MTSKMLTAGGVLAAVIALAGCGDSSSAGGNASTPAAPARAAAPEVSPAGDIPDDQAYVAYAPSGRGFAVKIPEGWSRSAAGAAVTFTDKLNAIRVETQAAGAPLTVRDAKQTELPKLAASIPGYRAGTVTAVRRGAGTAIRTTYLADAKADAVTGKAGVDAVERYVFFHGGKDLVVTLTGPKGADNVDPWRIVTDSVRFTG